MSDPIDTAYVLARRTVLSPPPDETHFYGPPGLFAPSSVERVMVSATFTWDRAKAQCLGRAWQHRYPWARVEVGGPAFGALGNEFVPGRWLKEGVTITTRGCPGCASPCLVPNREGELRCLEIKPGWNVQDNNLLAAPTEHIAAVLDMLAAQSKAAKFSGGLEARRLLEMDWFVSRLTTMRVHELFLAYDCPAERDPALEAIRLLRGAGLRQRQVRCYVLVGRGHDTVEAARNRLHAVFEAGGLPFAMGWVGEDSQRLDGEWKPLIRKWSRPAAIFATEGRE